MNPNSPNYIVNDIERNSLLSPLFEYVNEIINISKKANKKIIVWGLGKCGKFIWSLLSKRNVNVEFFIDEKIYIYAKNPRVYRSSILEYIDNSEIIILSSIKNYQAVEKKLYEYGYKKNENLFDIFPVIGESYLHTICNSNDKIRFDDLYSEDEPLYNNVNYRHQPSTYPNIDIVFYELRKLEQEFNISINFFDYGCGNGAMLVCAHLFGFNNLGGVELIEKLYKQAQINLDIVGAEYELQLGDAREASIDGYNCFYMFNPFGGEIFDEVIKNIQKSYMDHKRKIFLLYLNPTQHRRVLENSEFRLWKHLDNDGYDPLMNVYILGE